MPVGARTQFADDPELALDSGKNTRGSVVSFGHFMPALADLQRIIAKHPMFVVKSQIEPVASNACVI